MKVAKDEKSGLYYRPWTYDIDTIRAAVRDYKVEHITEKDIVFDIGGHLGSFTNLIKNVGCSIHGFEPRKESYELFRLNHSYSFNIACFNSAVVANDTKTANLYITDTSSEGTHSLYMESRAKSEKVSCVKFSDLCSKHNPTVIKIDTEGAEYELLKNHLPMSVHTLIVEFHLFRNSWRDKYKVALNSLMNEQGFNYSEEPTVLETTRAVVINFRRNT